MKYRRVLFPLLFSCALACGGELIEVKSSKAGFEESD